MLPEQQQRILGYFIEEARDHLNTIEQGLLDLQNTLNDSEMVNEIFRAAHSIKGGAAMLGLNSIQRTAHRFEDFFKVLKECQSIQIDQTIESLFLRMFDNLQALLEQLQSASGLTEDVANRLMSEVEPVFVTLEQHLESRVHQAGGTMQLEESFAAPTLTQPSTPAITASPVSVFQDSVPEILRQMLQLFKQPETPQTRQQLDQLCNQLAQLGEQFNLSGWCTLCATAAGAIANLDNTYRILAPIVIKEIKQAQELVLASRADAIATCEQLQALSLKTFLSDWEDTSTSFEFQDKQLAETIVIAQQKTTELFDRKVNCIESEVLENVADLSTEEQITDWAAEDNLSSLFALNSNDNNQWQESSARLDFNIEDDLESSLSKRSKDNLPLISSEETSALNSLFGEAQDTSLDLTQTEPAFCDLFKAPEADLENLDLLEVSTATTTGNSDLSSWWAEEPDTPTQIELDIKEFSFPLGADDLFTSEEESFTLSVVPSEANNDVDSDIDCALSNSSYPKQKFDDNWFVEPEIDLTEALECNLSNDSNEFLDAAVDATLTPAPEITSDIESSLTPSTSDLFGSVIAETQSSLELFVAPSDTSSVENTAQLMAEFNPSGEQLDFSLDSTSTELFSTEETGSSLELFDVPSSTSSVELDFSLDSTNTELFSTEESESTLELFVAPSDTSSVENTVQLMAFDLASEELDFSLESTNTELFSTEESESSLELFVAPSDTSSVENTVQLMAFDLASEELDFSLESTNTELFSTEETGSSLELFVAPASNPSVENAAQLMAGFELTGEELDFSLDSTNTELFSTEETGSSLELFDVPSSTSSVELDFSLESTNTELFSTEESESSLELFVAPSDTSSVENTVQLMAFDLASEELDFSLESTNTELFSTEETGSSLELFVAPASNPSVENAAQLMAGFELTGEELDFSLDSTNTELFSTEETGSSLELFDVPSDAHSVELDFSLESSSTDLLSEETGSSLELFVAPSDTSSVENTVQLMAGFELTGEELDFSLDSTNTELFSTEETGSSLELFDVLADASSVDNTAGSMAGFELTGEELDFSLDSSSTDLLSEETGSSLELFDVPSSNPSVENAAQLMAGFDPSGEELDFSLDSSSTDLLSEETGSSLELFDVLADASSVDNTAGSMAGFELTGEELDFSLDSSSTDLLSEETGSSLELFDVPSSNPSVENAAQLMAGFDPSGEELDFSLDSSSTELFSTEENESSLELFDVLADTSSVDNTAGSMAGFELTGEELDFSLESSSTDLLSEETGSSLELFDVPSDAHSVELDFSLESSSTDLLSEETGSSLELFDVPSDAHSVELDFSLESSSTDLLSEETGSSLELFDVPSDAHSVELDFSLESSSTDLLSEESESSLELFDVPSDAHSVENAAQLMAEFDLAGEELDFSLDSTSTNLLSEETQSSLELFVAPASNPSVENTAQLMAGFDLINSTEMTLEHELNRLDMGVEEMPSQTEFFHEDSAANVVSNLEVQGELPTEIATVAEDFAELEALLQEESTSNVVAQAEVRSDLNRPTVAPVTKAAAPESSNDEFGDLEKLLQETPTTTASPEPVKPPQKQAATNSRRSAFEQMMRVPVKQLDSISNQVGELVVYRNSLEQDQERLRQFLDNLLHQVQQLSDVGSRMQELYERSLVEASLLTTRTGSQSVLIDTHPASQGHITGINFDALEMDRFTGFHTLAQEMIELIVRVREASSDIEFVTGETEQVARQFRQVTTQLQEGITRSRMVPFSQIAERLPRAVRDISLKYGKQAELQIEGKDTLIDKVILEQLYDPMTHLVNNAITHGIESSEERSAKGKSPVGQITIRAFHQGNQTVITVSDDGAGIDPERVKAKAIKNGLITPEAANNMSRLDVYNLLFHAGFSTKDAVDEFAGRGVGMDVVLTSLSQIRGTITTDSTLGKGTTFTIRLPLTLSICKALCCLSDKARIAFPMDGVEQMIDIPVDSVITNAEGQSCIPWHDSLLPFRHLREYLSFNRQISRGTIYGSNRDDNMICVVVLRSADMFFAIQVDQVLGEQEIVIKQFEGPAPKPVGIAGATILGDGRIMPIADVLELIDLSMGRIRHSGEGTWWTPNDTSLPPENTSAARTEPMVLIIDDSITVRELLSMTFINAGYRVEQARDGQEAWDKLRDGLPCDLIFCDIEMPRMDGLELLSRMQQDAKLSQLPIAMLTSRGSDRHRQMALQLGASGYFTKPYLEEALLDGAQRMLKGEVLLVSSSNV